MEKEAKRELKIRERNVALANVNANKTFIWRETLTDGALPFRFVNMQAYQEIQDKKKMKESQLFDEKSASLVKSFAVDELFDKAGNQKYGLQDSLYCKKLKSYVYPRKYDAESKIYSCRQKGLEVEHDLPEADLSRHIFVIVNVSDAEGAANKEQKKEVTKLKVKITDKLDKIVDLATGGGGGNLFAGGKPIIELDVTVEKADLHDCQTLLIYGGAGGGKMMKWRRFRNHYPDSYWYISPRNTDAIKFIPLKDIIFMGFGMHGNYERNDMLMKFWWTIDEGEDSEKYETTVIEAELDQERVAFDVVLKDCGAKPFKVFAGQKLTIMVSAGDDSCTHQWYGQGGNDYKTLPDQEHLFDIERSNRDNNSSGVSSGQIPHILFSLC